jgi:hypothetical protein
VFALAVVCYLDVRPVYLPITKDTYKVLTQP